MIQKYGRRSIRSARGLAGAEFELSRVNVLLGANGAGKSEAMGLLANMAPGGFAVVRVEGGRRIDIQPHIRIDKNTINQFGTLAAAEQQHKGQRTAALSQRTQAALLVLLQQGQARNEAYVRDMRAWETASERLLVPQYRRLHWIGYGGPSRRHFLRSRSSEMPAMEA